MIECFKQQSKIISNYSFTLFIFHIYFYISQNTVLSLVTWKEDGDKRQQKAYEDRRVHYRPVAQAGPHEISIA